MNLSYNLAVEIPIESTLFYDETLSDTWGSFFCIIGFIIFSFVLEA